MDGITHPPLPVNEPNLTYAPGTAERAELERELARLEGSARTLPAYVGGQWRDGGGAEVQVVQPHDHQHVLGTFRSATTSDAEAAVRAAAQAAPEWSRMPFDERCAILLKAADLLAGPWRQRLNAATMLGQSKTAQQAEIDSACELIDFWRFNVHFAAQVLAEQPLVSAPGVWNRTDHRPLEGFVYAITPFNFTAIAGNLPTAPALMGNTVIWKPSPTQQLAASLTMELLAEAGMPPGVINMLPGDGLDVSKVTLAHPDLAGIHFTGSTATFQHLWRTVGENISSYRSYPRIVGETGGKDFIVAHPSADPDVLRVAMVRGAFEYQGQKCSAASRAYVPRSVWERIKDQLVADVEALTMGDVTDLSHFMGAVIDQRAFNRLRAAIARVQETDHLTLLAGGQTDDSVGWFVRPTLVESSDPTRPGLLRGVLRADAGRARLRGRPVRAGRRADGVLRAVRADRGDHRPGPGGDRLGRRGAAVRGRQLLRQRQAHRGGGGAAAVRRRPRLGHQRQGRRGAQPAPLDQSPVDQGDVRAADADRLPAHGVTGEQRRPDDRGRCGRPLRRCAPCAVLGENGGMPHLLGLLHPTPDRVPGPGRTGSGRTRI